MILLPPSSPQIFLKHPLVLVQSIHGLFQIKDKFQLIERLQEILWPQN